MSILAVLAQTAPGAYFAVILSVVLSATVTFLIAAAILRASRKTDLAAEAAGEDRFASAVSQTEADTDGLKRRLDLLVGTPERELAARLRVLRHHVGIAEGDDDHDQRAERHGDGRSGDAGVREKLFAGVDE